jgi:hypothetical protein
MSMILAGPRRVYVVVLFWQALSACRSSPVAPTADAPEPARTDAGNRHSPGRLLFRLRLHRVVWRRFVGATLLVFDPGPGAAAVRAGRPG